MKLYTSFVIDCPHQCDNQCLDESKICNGVVDCFDKSDELNCVQCDGSQDFR